jgi:sulfur relay protein TusB/DsrH
MMNKLIIMNTHDPENLDKALSVDAEILLMQDAVLFINNRIEANKKLQDHNIYALMSDVEKRGLKDRVLENVDLLDMDTLIDLLFSGKTVINL